MDTFFRINPKFSSPFVLLICAYALVISIYGIISVNYCTESPLYSKGSRQYIKNSDKRQTRSEKFNIFKYSKHHHIYPDFKPKLTPEELDTQITLLEVLSSALRKANITYMLFYGTLLGLYRHHSIIPWDDDMDVFVDSSRDMDLLKAVAAMKEYDLFQMSPRIWKFYKKNRPQVPNFRHTWPLIDIFFFEKNDTHIIQRMRHFSTISYRRDDMFPLQNRVIFGSSYPVICNIEKVLKEDYHVLDKCEAQSIDHRLEMKLTNKPVSIPCEDLYGAYPFVFRERRYEYMLETVKVGDHVIDKFRTELPCD